MKAIYIAAAAVALAGASASAQTVVNNPNNHTYVGVRATLDIPCPGDVKVGDHKSEVYKNGVGVSGGFIVNVPLVANLYVEPGLNFYYNANGYKKTPDDVLHHSVRESGMRVPVVLGYHFDFTPDVNLAVFVGPELQVGFSCDDYYTATNNGKHFARNMYSDGYGTNQRNRVSCNLKFGVGFNFCQNYYAGVEGSVGLTNLSAYDGVHYKQNRVGVTLGYNF